MGQLRGLKNIVSNVEFPNSCRLFNKASSCRDVWTRRRKEEAAQGAQEGRQGPRRGGPQVQAETKGAGKGPEGRGSGRLEKGPDGRGRYQEEREKVKHRLTGQKMDEGRLHCPHYFQWFLHKFPSNT